MQSVPHLHEMDGTNITLTLCPRCERPADPYVEYDTTLVLIDIMLLRPQAWRHAPRNRWPRRRQILPWVILSWMSTTYVTLAIRKGRRDARLSQWNWGLDVSSHDMITSAMHVAACSLLQYLSLSLICLVALGKGGAYNAHTTLLFAFLSKLPFAVFVVWFYPIEFIAVIAMYFSLTCGVAVRALTGGWGYGVVASCGMALIEHKILF